MPPGSSHRHWEIERRGMLFTLVDRTPGIDLEFVRSSAMMTYRRGYTTPRAAAHPYGQCWCMAALVHVLALAAAACQSPTAASVPTPSPTRAAVEATAPVTVTATPTATP